MPQAVGSVGHVLSPLADDDGTLCSLPGAPAPDYRMGRRLEPSISESTSAGAAAVAPAQGQPCDSSSTGSGSRPGLAP